MDNTLKTLATEVGEWERGGGGAHGYAWAASIRHMETFERPSRFMYRLPKFISIIRTSLRITLYRSDPFIHCAVCHFESDIKYSSLFL